MLDTPHTARVKTLWLFYNSYATLCSPHIWLPHDIPPCLAPKNVEQLSLDQKLCKFSSACQYALISKFSSHVLHSKRMALFRTICHCWCLRHFVLGWRVVPCLIIRFFSWFSVFNFKFCMKKLCFFSETFYWKLDAPAYHNKRKINPISLY